MMERTVDVGHGRTATVSVAEPAVRHDANPILCAADVNAVWRDPGMQVVTVHNAGVATLGSDTVLVFRSHLRCGMSVLGVARSADGLSGWRVDDRPFLVPASEGDSFGRGVDVYEQVEAESGGVEDARVNVVDGTFALTYSAYHAQVKDRVRVMLAETSDFSSVVRLGPVSELDMRNVVVFPRPIAGRYVGLFRPNDALPGATGGEFTQIRIGYTYDLRSGHWDISAEPVMRTGGGPSAFSDKIGPGAPPVDTPHGWLNVFHGVRSTMDGNPYVLGVAFHDRDDPSRVAMSSIPLLFPTASDCRVGPRDYVHVPNVVFSCGVVRRTDGTIVVYYGGNDTVMNVAFTHEDVLAEMCARYAQDPLTGRLLYIPWS